MRFIKSSTVKAIQSFLIGQQKTKACFLMLVYKTISSTTHWSPWLLSCTHHQYLISSVRPHVTRGRKEGGVYRTLTNSSLLAQRGRSPKCGVMNNQWDARELGGSLWQITRNPCSPSIIRQSIRFSPDTRLLEWRRRNGARHAGHFETKRIFNSRLWDQDLFKRGVISWCSPRVLALTVCNPWHHHDSREIKSRRLQINPTWS